MHMIMLTTTEKDGKIANIINKYGTGKSKRFGFFNTIGIIVTMILCEIALAIGWTLITNPESILNWFGI